MTRDRNSPPTEWVENAVAIDAEIGIYAWPSPTPGNDMPTIWHWCSSENRWCAYGTRNHTRIGHEPLSLSPSLLYPCCGLHGFIQEGKWISA